MSFSQESTSITKSSRAEIFEEIAGRTLMLTWLFYVLQSEFAHLVTLLGSSIETPEIIANFLKTVILLIFSLAAAGFTLTRRPARAVAAGFEPRLTAILGSYLLLVIPFMPSSRIDPFWAMVASAIMIVGLASCVYSLAWLGRSYSIMASARKLVVDGPYRIVRHPLYFCELVLVLGVTIVNFSVWSVLVAVAVALLLLRRMVNEERILTQAFPEYAEYARRVPRIIPRLRPLTAVGAANL